MFSGDLLFYLFGGLLYTLVSCSCSIKPILDDGWRASSHSQNPHARILRRFNHIPAQPSIARVAMGAPVSTKRGRPLDPDVALHSWLNPAAWTYQRDPKRPTI